MSNETIIKGALFVGIVIVIVMLFHKYGAQILAAAGLAAAAKGLLGSGLLAAPPSGSDAESAIEEETEEPLSTGESVADGSTVSDAADGSAVVEEGTAVAADGAELVEGGTAVAEGLTLTELGEALLPLAIL